MDTTMQSLGTKQKVYPMESAKSVAPNKTVINYPSIDLDVASFPVLKSKPIDTECTVLLKIKITGMRHPEWGTDEEKKKLRATIQLLEMSEPIKKSELAEAKSKSDY